MSSRRGTAVRRAGTTFLFLASITLLFRPGAPVAAQTVLAPAPVAPGGFLETADSIVVRPLLSPIQIQALLPLRGLFLFPPPYGTEAARITNPTDCGGADCVDYVGYSYWRNINNHVGSDTMLIFLSLDRSRGGAGPTLFSFNKVTGQVSVVGPLFDASSPFSWSTAEGWYFSATRPTTLYLSSGASLLRYDVLTRQMGTVFDAAPQFGSDKYIFQFHSSNDDRVHSATLRQTGTWATLGCLVYREDTAQFSYYPKVGDFDECQIDKSGRWLLIKENVDGAYGEDNRIIDLETGVERLQLDQNGAAGHSDNGFGYMVAADNYSPLPNSVRVFQFGQDPLLAPVVYHNLDWFVSSPNHTSHANARSGVPLGQQYACGSSANRTNSARANEIFCFRLDTSLDVLVVAPSLTSLDAPGGGDDYGKLPKGNLDPTGQYLIWTSNMSGNRLDAFIVRVPSQLLVATPSDVTPPTVSLTAPANGATLSGAATVSTTASDNVAVAGVRFLVDGFDLAPEDTAAPYSVAWDTTRTGNGLYTLTSIARDAAGNTATSIPVAVTVANGDVTPPAVSITLPANGATVSGAIAVAATASDNQGVTGVQFRLDGLPIGAEDSASPYSIAWDTMPATNGSHALTAVARDAAGNATTSTPVAVNVGNAVPGLDTGLVGYWKFDESSGSQALDSSGLGNVGSLLNGPIRFAGRVNGALSFDGIDDSVAVPNAASLNPFPLTAAVWMKTTATNLTALLNKYLPGSFNGFQVFTNGGSLCAWYFRDGADYIWDGTGCALMTSGFNDGAWHHVAFVVDAAGGKLYVDGGLRSSLAWTGTPGATTTSQGLTFAQFPGTATPYFQGALDEVRLYGRALSASEAASLAVGAPPPDATPPLLSFVGASGVSATGATIIWRTDEPADSQVEFGPTSAYGSLTGLDPSLRTVHAQGLGSLSSYTVYHYRVRSRDAAGNLATSGDYSFRTARSRHGSKLPGGTQSPTVSLQPVHLVPKIE